MSKQGDPQHSKITHQATKVVEVVNRELSQDELNATSRTSLRKVMQYANSSVVSEAAISKFTTAWVFTISALLQETRLKS